MATPTTTLHAPGPGNVFIPAGFQPNPGATRMMQVEFSRNPATFAFNQYAQIVNDAATKGYYVELDTTEAVRVVNLQDFEWPDGNDAPKGHGRFLKWRKFATNRRAFPWQLGFKTRDNAAFEIVGANSRMSSTQAMTARSYDAITVMTTSGNWPAANTSATVDALLSTSGASWTSSSTTQLYIMKSFHAIVRTIQQQTGGAVSVNGGEIGVVISPTIAHGMRETAEVQQFIVNHEQSVPAWEYTGIWTAYGLPPQMYGVRIIVEDAVRVSTRPGLTATTGYLTGNNAVFVSRPGGLNGGVEGAPTFSTVTAFVHEDMTVETKDDTDNRRVDGRVVDDLDVTLTAPASGYLVQDVTD